MHPMWTDLEDRVAAEVADNLCMNTASQAEN